MDPREELLAELAAELLAVDPGHPLRVGVDGVCGSGKTTFAADLVRALRRGDRDVVRLDPDGFHHIAAIRHRQTADVARGYYDDGFDFTALERLTLRPLGPGGDRHYAAHVHDLATDEVAPQWADAAPDAIVVFDATFLQRGDLRDAWDEVVFLDVPRAVAVERGVARDAPRLGGAAPARAAYESRYMAACDLYLVEEDPLGRASVVVDNTDPRRPRRIR